MAEETKQGPEYRVVLELDNAAMLEPSDVVRALRDLAEHIEQSGSLLTHNVRDYNGNVVGYGAVRNG